MRKPQANKRLVLSRETLTNLDHLDRAQLDKVAGGTSNPCTGGSSCFPHCTCPPA